jgi:DNA-directed RNA polymerase specialized sigma24 family protein
MDDRDIMAAIAAGDADGIAYAYDKHAASLYGYCHSMVPQPADAAVALQDTFVIASVKLSGLRDPRRLRPWLYAVARNECRRWLRAADVGPVPPGGTDLGPAEREIIELNLGHHLAGSDLAAVLGVSRHQAHALVARARSRMEETLGAPLAARGGDQAARVRPEPIKSALPRTLRDEVFRLCVEGTPEALAYREWVIRRAGQFGASGFPRPARRPRQMLAVAGTAAAAAVLAVIASTGIVTVLTVSRSHAPGPLNADRAGGPATASTASTGGLTAPGSAPATRHAARAAGAPASAAPVNTRPPVGRPSRTDVPTATSVPGWQRSSPPASSAEPSPSPSASPTAPASRAPSPKPSPDLQWPPSASPSATSFP